MSYDVTNWYWIVDSSATEVYSSARGAYVTLPDASYSAWLAAGNKATLIDTEANLKSVLAMQFAAGWPALALQQAAQAALDKSDTTVVRCYSAGVAVPSAWQTYRAALRAIVNGTDTTSTVLPSLPAYPAST